MSATITAGIDSLTLKVISPKESDGVTPRDDLIGIKVWYSTTTGFDPLNNQGTLAYDGTGLDITITGLLSGTTYYVKYALISEIEPDYWIVSSQLSGTPVYETQTVDNTAPPTPINVSVTAGVGTLIIKHDAPSYVMGRGHKKTHVFGLKETPTNTAAGYTFANAAAAGEIAQFTGNIFSLSSDPATVWHIWLKWETNNGILSDTPSGGTAGTQATTSQDVTTLLSALSNQITTSELSTTLRDNVSNLNSQYTIKVGSGGQIAGFGIASTATGLTTTTSDFGIQADKFWIAPPAVAQATAPSIDLYRGYVWVDTSVTPNVTKYYTGTAWSTTPQTIIPFSVVTTPTTINGVVVPVGVYIDAGYIKEGTITNAKIANATISAAKISSIDATTITVNQITASQINSNGLSIKDSLGNVLLDAGNNLLGASLFVGTGSNQRLLSTIGAFAATPNTTYIGAFASAPTFTADKVISSWNRSSGITTLTTTVTHGFVLGTKVTIYGADGVVAAINGTYEIIEITSSTKFKIVNAGADVAERTAQGGIVAGVSGYLYTENSVYKNTTDNNTYILTGSTLAWALFLEKGKTPVLGTDYYAPATFNITSSGVIFKKSSAGIITPATVVLTTTYNNISSPNYAWYKDNAPIFAASSASYTINSSDYASATSHTYKCEIIGVIAGVPSSVRSDSITVPLIEDGLAGQAGAGAIQVLNSNENITFTADTTGYSNITFTGGSSIITAYIGSTQLTYATSGANTFSATLASTGATVAAGTGSGTTYTVLPPTVMTAETATATITITVRNALQNTTTTTTTIAYSLSRKGTKPALGTDYYQPPTFSIQNSSATFKKDSGGTLSPTGIVLTTAYNNITSPTYQWYRDGIAISGQTASSYTVSRDDLSSYSSRGYSCTVTGTMNGVASSTLAATITIVVVNDGTSGTGTAGARGSTWGYISGQSTWSDAVANSYFSNLGLTRVLNDTITQYYGTAFAQTKFYTPSSDSWTTVTAAIDGNLLVSGTIASSKLQATTLEGISATIGTLRTATTGSRVEIADNIIRVYEGNIIRVKIGNLSL
jgi:hypothetical protein